MQSEQFEKVPKSLVKYKLKMKQLDLFKKIRDYKPLKGKQLYLIPSIDKSIIDQPMAIV